MEYLQSAIDILSCHYDEMGSGGKNQTYSEEQVMWALEIAVQVMIEKQNKEG